MYDVVLGYTTKVQAVSCDELLGEENEVISERLKPSLFLSADVTDVLKESKASPLTLANHLRKEVRRRTDCPASVGMGPNLLLARLATATAKPDGVKVVLGEEAQEFVDDVPLIKLPGIGK